MSTFQPRRDKMVRTEGVAPSRACAHRILAPARILFRHVRKNGSIHRDVRPARCLTKTVRRYLRLGCMLEAEGLAPSPPVRVSRLPRAAFAALTRFEKNWGLERDSHPRPSPYEGAALTAAPSSQNGDASAWRSGAASQQVGPRARARSASQMLRVLPLKRRRLHD